MDTTDLEPEHSEFLKIIATVHIFGMFEVNNLFGFKAVHLMTMPQSFGIATAKLENE